MWVRWCKSLPYLLNISETRVKITQTWLCSSERERLRGKFDTTCPTRIWRNISEIRGKITQPWRWSSMDESHQGESDCAICQIISEIRVKIIQSLLCSSERERLRGKSDDTSPSRIRRDISEIRGKITQPWRWSLMSGIRWCRSRPFLLNNKLNTSQNYSTVTLFIRAWTPSMQARWCKSDQDMT